MARLRPASRVLALPLAAILGLAPAFARAAPAGDDEAPAEDDPDIATAKSLFNDGLARYNAADYGKAVELWLEAYTLVPPTPENQLIKAQLIYNVARAQQKWFVLDEDITHLRQSKEILERYLGEIDDLYEEGQAAMEREKIEEQIAELDEQIAEVEAEEARREAELAKLAAPKFDEEADAREAKRNRSMIGAGAGLTVLGLGSVTMLVFGVLGAGAADRQLEEQKLASQIPDRQSTIGRGQVSNALIVVGSVSGVVFLAAGIPLLAIGVRDEKQRKARREAAGLEARVRFDGGGAMLLPGGGGLSLRGRF